MGDEYETIRLRKDAYELLERRRGANESLSDVVERLTTERPITDLAGVFSEGDVEKIRDARDAGNESV